MKKYLATIEFRYYGVRNFEKDSKSKMVTIGVFDEKESAHFEANKILEELEKRFKLNPNYNRRERFTPNSFHIISDLGYMITPFSFYVKIETLNYTNDINYELDEILKDIKAYKKLKESDEN